MRRVRARSSLAFAVFCAVGALACLALGGFAWAAPTTAASASSPLVSQSAQASCLAATSAHLTLPNAVAAGDDLVLVVSGQGYGAAAPTVTGVSDPVNGQWSALVNHASLTTDNLRYLSYAVYHLNGAKAAPGGLTVTVNQAAGQGAASAVLLDVAGPVAEDHVAFDSGLQRSASPLTSPAVNATAGDLAVGLFGAYNFQQSVAPGTGWTQLATAGSCTRALAESQVVPSDGAAAASMQVGSTTRYLSGVITFSSGTATTSPPPPPPSPPASSSPPTITGTAQQGATLTATNGTWTNSPTSYKYQWQRCSAGSCTGISGAAAQSYTAQAADVGDTLNVVVTAVNAGGQASATSQQTSTVTAPPPPPAPPASSSPPVISGTAQQGQTLSVSAGTWTNSPTSYTYQWEDCDSAGANCANVTGAQSQSYVLAAADVGHTVRATVTAKNAGGSASQASAQTATVTSAPSSPPSSSGFQSVVWWLAWDGGTLSSLPAKAVTQVDLFSLASCVSAGNPSADCTGPTSVSQQFNGVSNPSGFVSTVHQLGAKAIITIGGSTNPNWYYPCSGSNAAAFAQNLVNYAHGNGFDGVDLDIEQDTTTGSPAFTAADLQACAQDVYSDAKAVGLLVTSDVDPSTNYDIGRIEGPYVDQFNAMSYGATGATLANSIGALESKSGIPASKITEGKDIQDYKSTVSACGSDAQWAKQNGLAGAAMWFGQQDESDSPAYGCLNAVAPYVG